MVGGGMGSFWTCLALLAVASAGPLHRYPRESEDYQNDLSAYANYTANEVCFSEGEVFQKGDMMPNPGPCEECRCEPPSIVCNMIKCPVNNNGCRTIQRANHCCPDYNCVCDYNGQLYNDGERLDLPEEPCQVCYCKGGEVMCNSITCYHRDDCDPIQVPGQCCPKYENCPVRDMGSSSSVEKNVLVRSTNKTNHVAPKREMNPWLLTKLPSVSSSSPPKNSQDPTTEGGSIIIVSDWLTERKTTTEDATSSDDGRPNYNFDTTDEPDLFTNSDHFTTDLKQDFSSYGTMIMKNSDTITPVDEVIFTRIDAPKQNKINLEESTSISSKDLKNMSTNILDRGNSTDLNITEAPVKLTIINKNVKELNSSSNMQEVQDVLEVRPLETTVDIQTSPESPVKIQEPVTNLKRIISTVTPVYPSALNITSESNGTDTDPATTSFNTDLTKEIPTIGVQKDNIMLENIFGIDGLSIGEIEEETTTIDLLGSHTTERGEPATDLSEFTDNALEVQTQEGSKVGKLKVTQNEIKTTVDVVTDTTTNGVINHEVTTPFFTEVNLEKDNVSKHDYATELPTIKKGSVPNTNSEIVISATVNQEAGSTNENTLTPGTEATNKIHPSGIKIKKNNFNSSSTQNNSMHYTKGSILVNNGPTIPVTTQETVIVSGINSKSQNVVLNNTSSNVNEVPPNGMAKDIAVSTIVTSGGDSDDGVDSTSDVPPVLELNSHVPFLQLGGHENTDSAMNKFGENYQTTITNEKDIADNNPVSNLTNTFDNRVLAVNHTNSTEDLPSLKISGEDNNNQSTIQEIKRHNGENGQVKLETTTDMSFSTPHIPLTPGDLKVIAEYLINDTIKTVPVKNVSDYAPNLWLKGNLTSEENMSSILSAANISIAIMNKTDDRAKKFITETTTRPNEAIRIDKFEKEKLSLGNSALNDLKIGNKTGFIRGKSDEYSDSPKINSEPETPLNDEAKETTKPNKLTNTETNIKKSTVQSTTQNINGNAPEKYQNNIKPLNKNDTQSQPSTAQAMYTQSVSRDASDNNLRFENVNPAGNVETNQYAQNNFLRNEKLSDVTTSATTSRLQKLLTP